MTFIDKMFDIDTLQAPNDVDTIIHTKWLLLFEKNRSSQAILKRYEHHSLAIKNGLIIETAPTDTISKNYQASHEFKLANHIVFPALYNAKTSCAASLFQFYGLGRPTQIRRSSYLEPLEQQFLSEELAEIAVEISFSELIKNGCAGFSDHYFFSNIILKSLKKHPFDADLAIFINPLSTRLDFNPNAVISHGLKLHDNYKINENIRWSFATDNINALNNDTLQKISSLGYETDIGIKCPLHRSKSEIDESIRLYQRKPMQRLEEYGLLGPNTVIHNHYHLTSTEHSKLQKYNCKELLLADTPARFFNQKSMIGSDNFNTASFSIKELLFNIKQRSSFDNETLLRMASCFQANGSNEKSIERGDQIASLKPQQKAHLCAIEINSLSETMAHDPVEQIVYNCGHQSISHLWLAGQLKLADHELTDIDYNYLIRQIKPWHDKFKAKI